MHDAALPGLPPQPQKPAPHQVRQRKSEIRKRMNPTTIRTTPTTSTSTLPPLELTPQVRIAPTAITMRLRMIPIGSLFPEASQWKLP
jgi:hypothetical protein